MTGTFINVGTVLLGTLIGTLLGARLPEGMQQRVLMGLGMATLVLGVTEARLSIYNRTPPKLPKPKDK